ncbi:MAG: hypothetical protein CBC13_05430 [Planctomycetia bacterium TMED53]|nr:MAG: hypothetical protein CBC13_05430 [Planctomycetia bacterium TMED53]
MKSTRLYAAGLPGNEPDGSGASGGWRLENSSSAYLREHAENPVEWWPWGDEAFEAARAGDRPVFLSIGYSSCHWCHVMRRESFSDSAIAAFLNAHFISIKVDREDLPHVDEVYMDAVRAMTGGGGWPLSVFVFPDGKPFYGGTYFPPRQRFNRPGFLELLTSIERAWREDRDRMQESATGLIEHLEGRDSRLHEGQTLELFLSGGIQAAATSYTSDPAGFGNAPRFPAPRLLQFLAGEGHCLKDSGSVQRAVSVLEEMARGGIYDQVGGGFHRYSVDASWEVPHFEKMLYNQGSLAESYLEVGRITGDDQLLEVGEKSLDAMIEQFQLSDGSFAGSWDADSGGVEGSYYVWTPDQVEEVLDHETAQMVCQYLGISESGNFEGGEASVPRQALTWEALAESVGKDLDQVKRSVEAGIKILLKTRETRVAPKRDDKVILGWNALAISGLARGATILEEERFEEAAQKAFTALDGVLVTETGFLRRRDSHLDDQGNERVVEGNPATLQDAALWMKCALDLYEMSFDARFVSKAESCFKLITESFGPLEAGHGYHEAPVEVDLVLGRRRDYFDGAIPSGNATMARNLLRLFELTGSTNYQEIADQLIAASLSRVGPYPMGAAELLLAVQAQKRSVPVIVISGDPAQQETQEMLKAVRGANCPFVLTALRTEDGSGEDVVTVLEGRPSKDGAPLAYVCIDQVCEVPISSVGDLKERLAKISGAERADPHENSSPQND